jgi:2,5-dihydroxypyridine 5,6-dioxygenase
MLSNRIEGKWIDSFEHVFALSEIGPGDPVAILSDTGSREINVSLAELALHRLGAKAFHIVMPNPPQTAPLPVRSTGSTTAIGGSEPVLAALCASKMVVDLTVEGLLHAPELPRILSKGARMLYISNEHPDVLERLTPDPGLKEKVLRGIGMLKEARSMRVTSDAGTDVSIDLADIKCGGSWGYADSPGCRSHWPGGVIAGWPRRGALNGKVVMGVGDLNLTFKRYVERPITLHFENDYAVEIAGEGLDAELMRSYLQGWNDPEAYASAHIGWGMNPKARWDSQVMYDKGDINGTELRAFAGNFLFSMGANEHVGRHTLGHFDLPMRGCTIALDNQVVVDKGRLTAGLA